MRLTRRAPPLEVAIEDCEEPARVYACPHDAAMRVEPRTHFGL